LKLLGWAVARLLPLVADLHLTIVVVGLVMKHLAISV